MKTIKIVQVIAAVGVLAAGALFAAQGSAGSCQSSAQPWNEFYTDACSGHADFVAAAMGASSAAVYASVKPGATYAGIVGLDANQNVISGCKAEDTTADGNSVSDDTGCQNGRFVIYAAEW